MLLKGKIMSTIHQQSLKDRAHSGKVDVVGFEVQVHGVVGNMTGEVSMDP